MISFPDKLPKVTLKKDSEKFDLVLFLQRPEGFPDLEEDIETQVTLFNVKTLFTLKNAVLATSTGERVEADSEGHFPLPWTKFCGAELAVVGEPDGLPDDKAKAKVKLERQRMTHKNLVKSLDHARRKAEDEFANWKKKIEQRAKAARMADPTIPVVVFVDTSTLAKPDVSPSTNSDDRHPKPTTFIQPVKLEADAVFPKPLPIDKVMLNPSSTNLPVNLSRVPAGHSNPAPTPSPLVAASSPKVGTAMAGPIPSAAQNGVVPATPATAPQVTRQPAAGSGTTVAVTSNPQPTAMPAIPTAAKSIPLADHISPSLAVLPSAQKAATSTIVRTATVRPSSGTVMPAVRAPVKVVPTGGGAMEAAPSSSSSPSLSSVPKLPATAGGLAGRSAPSPRPSGSTGQAAAVEFVGVGQAPETPAPAPPPAQAPAPVAENVKCSRCAETVPKANLALHSLTCHLRKVPCDVCGQFVENVVEHMADEHTQQLCKCGVEVPKKLFGAHQAERCSHRMLVCRLCELPVMAKDKAAHDEQCGARTDVCAQCGARVLLREFSAHERVCGLTCQPSQPAPPRWAEKPVLAGPSSSPGASLPTFSSAARLSGPAVPPSAPQASAPLQQVTPTPGPSAAPSSYPRGSSASTAVQRNPPAIAREVDLTSRATRPSSQPSKAPDSRLPTQRAPLHHAAPEASPVAAAGGLLKRQGSGSMASAGSSSRPSSHVIAKPHAHAPTPSHQPTATLLPGPSLSGGPGSGRPVPAPTPKGAAPRLPKAAAPVPSTDPRPAPTPDRASLSSLYDELRREQIEASEDLARRIDEYERAMATTSDRALAAAVFDQEKQHRELMALSDELLAVELHAQEQAALAQSPPIPPLEAARPSVANQHLDEQLARALAEEDGVPCIHWVVGICRTQS
eukprot:EG_transcript_2152